MNRELLKTIQTMVTQIDRTLYVIPEDIEINQVDNDTSCEFDQALKEWNRVKEPEKVIETERGYNEEVLVIETEEVLVIETEEVLVIEHEEVLVIEHEEVLVIEIE